MTPRDREKLRIGWEVAAREGCMSDFASALGVSRPAVTQFLKKHDDLHRALTDGRRKPCLSDQETAERALMCAQAHLGLMNWTHVGRCFGVARSTMIGWSKRHEDEILEAIDELRAERRAA